MDISPLQLDILKELINIGVGRAAGMLNQMVRHHIVLQVPEVKITTHKELSEHSEKLGHGPLAAVELRFSGPFNGTSALIFPSESANNLVCSILDAPADGSDLDMLRIGTLQEVGNIVLNGVMGSIGNMLKQHLEYTPPSFEQGLFDSMILSRGAEPQAVVLLAQTHFSIKQVLIEGDIVIIFEVGSFATFISMIDQIMPAQA